jgi:hypothetical protein
LDTGDAHRGSHQGNSLRSHLHNRQRGREETMNITMIPATLQPLNSQPINSTAKKNVGAYARVSTNLEEQESSFAAQVDHYTRFIQENTEWNFAGLYSDEGLSAVSTAKRDGFNRMIKDALDGKMDMIITKSVSRFARNTVDSLTAIRKLKEKHIYVYFRKRKH